MDMVIDNLRFPGRICVIEENPQRDDLRHEYLMRSPEPSAVRVGF